MGRIEDGKAVIANYMDEQVRGTVESSRVKYGGKIQYTVKLDRPVQLRWRSNTTDVVLVDQNNIIEEPSLEIYSPFETVNS